MNWFRGRSTLSDTSGGNHDPVCSFNEALVEQTQAQLLPGRREGLAGKWTRSIGWAFAVLALLLFDIVFVKGYQFGVGDQNFYLPQLQAELDSSLYPGSTTIASSTNKFSLFIPFFAVPARYLGLEWTFLLAYLVASAGFYFVCFRLAEKLTGDRPAAYGFLLLMLPVTFVSETATVMWDSYLTQRGVALPVCLLGVYHILNRKHVFAYFLFGLAALIHPITAAAFAAACSGALVYDLWRRYIMPQVVVLAGGAMFAGAGLLLWKLLTSTGGDSGFFSPTTPEWLAILRQRVPYMLPELSLPWIWSCAVWFLLFLVAWLAKPVRMREDAMVMAIVISCGVLLAVSLLFASVIPFLPLARFELARSLLIVILFARIYLAAAFWAGLTSSFSSAKVSATFGAVVALSLYSQYLSLSRVAAVICALLAMVASQRSVIPEHSRRVFAGALIMLAIALLRSEFLSVLGFFPRLFSSRWFPGYSLPLALLVLIIVTAISAHKYLRSRSLFAACGLLFCLANASYFSREGWGAKTVHLPGRLAVTPWTQVQLWARQHTAKDAVFLAPWRRPSGFPIFSHRSTVADWESGADAKFNYTFARQWQERKNDLENFDDLATADFCRLKTKYRFYYIVTKNKQILQFPLLYKNTEFSIYQFTDQACREIRLARDDP
jgi:uncharacterized protein DUF6798